MRSETVNRGRADSWELGSPSRHWANSAGHGTTREAGVVTVTHADGTADACTVTSDVAVNSSEWLHGCGTPCILALDPEVSSWQACPLTLWCACAE